MSETTTQQKTVTANITSAPVTSTNLKCEATSTTITTTTTTTTTSKTTAGNSNIVQETIKSSMEELLQPIFYFPGMSCLIGSALSEGVYVGEKLRDLGLDDFDDKKSLKILVQDDGSETVKSVKKQVTALTSDFRGLQNLLNKLPTFLSNDSSGNPSYHRSQEVDEPIHGEFYFPEIQKFENINASLP